MSEYQPIYQTFMAPLFKELIFLFNKDAIHLSKVTVKYFIILQKVLLLIFIFNMKKKIFIILSCTNFAALKIIRNVP